jgi:hypothetical protein
MLTTLPGSYVAVVLAIVATYELLWMRVSHRAGIPDELRVRIETLYASLTMPVEANPS